MKPLVKMMLILAALFASTLLFLKGLGILTVPQIESWLSSAQSMSPWIVALIVAGLLFSDLFIAVPTMTLCILAGYFLGAEAGATAAISGMMAAGIGGHVICRYHGLTFMRFVTKDDAQITEATNTFTRHGLTMILLSRAVPILPEVTACLSGATRMGFLRFLGAWTVSTVPYAVITTYAGSVSSLSNPKPALITAALLSSALWLAWFSFHRKQKRTADQYQ